MGTYVITGSASGMGAAAAARLRSAGHRVIGVDLRDADVVADLGGAEGRAHAVREILALSGGTLDGVAAVAGVGPSVRSAAVVVSINYFGPVALLDALRPALERSGAGRAVVISSNSASTVPVIDDELVELLLAGDEEAARKRAAAAQNALPAATLESAPSIVAYATSKLALARWVRRTAVTPQWARRGILLNAIAPGAVLTPLMTGSTGVSEAPDADDFPTPMPLGVFGEAADIAFWIEQFLRPEARFTTGSILYVDGGTDAAMRADAQPSALRM
ncbi:MULTISPECIES: SDR family oxidoreductase [unclassified Streptomyces]|uniref:SDR family oxidoreductase n=1 Tax=unclassified Streptomyces TaxID=2593676 RepID=UPI000DB94135|nr:MULTISPECIES: SDR family oxidoreductase [unclassified Streptomyces]MYT75269.1 SDR family oxidoreductase [Streptomyces sp. SID8367]RAJ77226.1 NAD(P)-dependent dehydrogenase (short-subunit alcohol dehydrogenase family) [Streptomyces sp. PsTaAH-137]